MDNEPFSEESSSSSEYKIEVVGYGPKTIIYGLHTVLTEFERHFENISTKYKYMALTWLLATFGGIGFLMSSEINGLLFNHFIGIIVISLIGLIGISLIWHLDMNVYHRFWSAILIEEILMEERYAYLLQSRRIAFLIDESRERIFSQGLLYLVANTLSLITIGISFIFLFEQNIKISIIISTATLFVITIMWLIMIKLSKKVENVLYNIIEENKHSSKFSN